MTDADFVKSVIIYTSLYSWFNAVKNQLMARVTAANWIRSQFEFLLDRLARSVDWNMVCLVVAWQSVDGRWCQRQNKCFSAVWVLGWTDGRVCTASQRVRLHLNIPWKCCGSTVLFELRESLNKVFNSCIDFSTTARKSQSYFLVCIDAWLTSLCLVDNVVLPAPRALFTFVTLMLLALLD